MNFYCILAVYIQNYPTNSVLSAVSAMYEAPSVQEVHT
jgi:hypothetical protein